MHLPGYQNTYVSACSICTMICLLNMKSPSQLPTHMVSVQKALYYSDYGPLRKRYEGAA
jgi:hypothetical protein